MIIIRHLFATFTGVALCTLSQNALAQPTPPSPDPNGATTTAPASPTPKTAAPNTPAPQASPAPAQAAPLPEQNPPAQNPEPPPSQPTAPQAPLENPLKREAPEPKTRMATGWGLGVSAGTTSGIGISTRRYFDNGAGVHVGGLYVYLKDWQWGNIGLQGMYTLARGRKTRLYGLFGTQLSFQVEPQEADGGVKRADPWSATLFVGPGLGFEMHFTKHFGWAIELPLHAVISLDPDAQRLPLGGRVNFFPGANTAFTFYFK